MGNKRKREGLSSQTPKKKQRKKFNNDNKIIKADNQFKNLNAEEGVSDSDVIYDFQPGQERTDDIVLVDSDKEGSDDIFIESDDEGKQNGNKVSKMNGALKDLESVEGDQGQNAVVGNQDFIEFGFSSSEDEEPKNEDDYSDDGNLSDDLLGGVHTLVHSKSAYPWVKGHDHSKQREIADWLTMEMKDFVNYISPSKKEIITRNDVIKQLQTQISSYWPRTEVHVFGSSATDLYLPGSDIDLVVISDTGDYELRSRLYQLSSFLRNKNLAKNIEVIAKAKVPIVKFVTPGTNINIDISFERTNGIEAARRIRSWLETTPGLRELVLIVKQFLRSRRLNNVHVGGLGGYSTIILCYHFLQLHPRLSTKNMVAIDNLGALLIEFFELYGRNFSYDNLIISIDPDTGAARYLRKRDYPSLNTSKNPFSIVIQDPADKDNNISRSSYNLRDVKKAFGGAFQLLVDKCYTLNSASYKGRIGQLILGDIIKYKGKERDFNDDRHKVINHALISHRIETDVSSSGELHNSEYYYSDVTVASDDDSTYIENQNVSKTVDTKNQNETKKGVSDYLSIENSKDESDEDESESQFKKLKSSLDKETKRDYWLQKGLEF